MLNVSDFTGFTSTVDFRSAANPPATARTVIDPGRAAVSTPNWFTEAMFGFELVHLTATSRRSAPAASRTRAVCGTVAPTRTRRAPPSIAIDAGAPADVVDARELTLTYEPFDAACSRVASPLCAPRRAGTVDTAATAAARATRRADSTDLVIRIALLRSRTRTSGIDADVASGRAAAAGPPGQRPATSIASHARAIHEVARLRSPCSVHVRRRRGCIAHHPEFEPCVALTRRDPACTSPG